MSNFFSNPSRLFYLFCFVINATYVTPILAQDNHNIVGLWETTLVDKGVELRTIFQFEATDSDSLACHFHWPEMGMYNLSAGKIVLVHDSLFLPGLKAKYHGDHISALFTAIGIPMDLTMTRVDDIPKFPIECPERKADWIFETGAPIWSSLVIHQDHLYVGNDSGKLYAIDLSIRETIWSFEALGLIRSKCHVTENQVYFTSDDGFLYSLDRQTGSLKWKVDIGNAVSPRIEPAKDVYTYDYLCSAPVLDQNRIYIGSMDSCLYSLNAQSGDLLWRRKTGGMVRSTPLVKGETVFAGSWDNHMYALNKDNGDILWKYDAGWIVQSSPALI